LLRYFKASRSPSDRAENTRREGFFVHGLFRRALPFSFAITREGVLYIIFVFLLSLAAINTGNNLLYIILAALLSTIVVSGIVSRNSLKQISLSLQMPENVFVGERVSIKVSMRNLKTFFPSFSIRVQDPDTGRKHPFFHRIGKLFARKNGGHAAAPDKAVLRQAAYFPILRPGETRAEYTVQSFPRRGLFRLDGFWISTRFPFGFFRRGQRIRAKGEVLVYPLVQEISSFFHLLPFLPGRLEGRHVGPGENLFSIRKYQEEESARIIDWKATAKTGELMAREFAREEESKFCLILDTRLHARAGASPEDVFEKAVSLAASIAAYFLKEGAEMEFLTPYDHVPRGTGVDHLYRILRSLAVVDYETMPASEFSDSRHFNNFTGILDARERREILSDKVFKIIITSKPRGSFPSAVWRSSHVVFFDEL
jgi:uncharacterized protein (DUF58 family)